MREAGGEEDGGFGVQRQRGKVPRVSQNCRRPDGQTDRQTESAGSIKTFHCAEKKTETI